MAIFDRRILSASFDARKAREETSWVQRLCSMQRDLAEIETQIQYYCDSLSIKNAGGAPVRVRALWIAEQQRPQLIKDRFARTLEECRAMELEALKAEERRQAVHQHHKSHESKLTASRSNSVLSQATVSKGQVSNRPSMVLGDEIESAEHIKPKVTRRISTNAARYEAVVPAVLETASESQTTADAEARVHQDSHAVASRKNSMVHSADAPAAGKSRLGDSRRPSASQSEIARRSSKELRRGSRETVDVAPAGEERRESVPKANAFAVGTGNSAAAAAAGVSSGALIGTAVGVSQAVDTVEPDSGLGGDDDLVDGDEIDEGEGGDEAYEEGEEEYLEEGEEEEDAEEDSA